MALSYYFQKVMRNSSYCTLGLRGHGARVDEGTLLVLAIHTQTVVIRQEMSLWIPGLM